MGCSVRGVAPDLDLSLRLHHDHDQQAAGQEEEAQESARGEGGSRRAQPGQALRAIDMITLLIITHLSSHIHHQGWHIPSQLIATIEPSGVGLFIK